MIKLFKVAPIIGQQVIVSFGRETVLGIVVAWKDEFPYGFCRVRHPVTGVERDFAPENVKLIPIYKEGSV